MSYAEKIIESKESIEKVASDLLSCWKISMGFSQKDMDIAGFTLEAIKINIIDISKRKNINYRDAANHLWFDHDVYQHVEDRVKANM